MASETPASPFALAPLTRLHVAYTRGYNHLSSRVKEVKAKK